MIWEGTPVQCKRAWERDQDEGPSKRVKKAQGTERTLAMELQDLLEEVSETNWLLPKLWQTMMEEHQEVRSLVQAVEGVCNEVCGIAWEMEWSELQKKLADVKDDQNSSGED